MSPLDDGDLRLSSTGGRSMKKRSIRTRSPIPVVKRDRSIKRPRNPSGKAPRVSLDCNPTGRCTEEISCKCAFAALPSLNETTQDPKYEFVEAVGCIESRLEWVFHCNFIARPIGGNEADYKLCFAEVEAEVDEVEASKGIREPIFTCRFACILGPRGSKTGLHGCKSCRMTRGYIQHPIGGLLKKKKKH